jgi:tetratricopeptide (TPR) repeat protein
LPPGGDADYRFTHTLVSDTIYSLLLKAELADLHGRVGEALEQVYATHLDDRVELLARHYHFSDRASKALEYLILAGNKSARGFANAQARQDYEQALGVLKQVEPSLDQILQVYTGLGDVLTRVGEYTPAREYYFTAMDALDRCQQRSRQDDAPIRASLHRKVATTCERQGDYPQALSELSAARAALEEMPEPAPVERGWVLNDTGWIHFRRGDLDGAGVVLLESLRLVEDGRNYDLISSIYNRLGGVCYQKDQLDLASSYVRKSLFLRQEIGDTNGVARSYNNLGLLRWKRGDWDSALDDFSRSLKLHANLGDVEGSIELHSNLGLLHLDRGNFEDARRHLETGLASARQIGHSYHVGLIYLHFCRLYVSLENWETALKYCRLGLQTFNELGVMENLVDLNTYAGLAYLGLGDVNMAEKCACDALELYSRLNSNDRTGMSEDRGRALRLLAQVFLARKLPEKAASYLKESAAIFRHVGNQVEQGRTSMIQAQQAMQMGSIASARILLNEARLVFRQLGARIDLKKVEALVIR